ncbi:11551_t:CDS:2, partial [Acaulospora colombiana]
KGLSRSERTQRELLFGANLIDIKGKSIQRLLVEENIARMREMARYSCSVKLISRDSTSVVDSDILVPGDIINLSDPIMSTFPCDVLLLVGDAIVNESMLTGESVPISKSPVKSEDLMKWRQTGEVTSEIAKSMLYAGTKVVRIRGPAQTSAKTPALGYVVRTGFNTTKGALVRSM